MLPLPLAPLNHPPPVTWLSPPPVSPPWAKLISTCNKKCQFIRISHTQNPPVKDCLLPLSDPIALLQLFILHFILFIVRCPWVTERRLWNKMYYYNFYSKSAYLASCYDLLVEHSWTRIHPSISFTSYPCCITGTAGANPRVGYALQGSQSITGLTYRSKRPHKHIFMPGAI